MTVHLHPDRLLYSIGTLAAKTTAMYYTGQHLEVEVETPNIKRVWIFLLLSRSD